MEGLFRRQVIERQVDRLHGEVLVTPRLSHSLVTVLVLVWLAALVAWLLQNTYARKETVSGWLEPPDGVVRIYPQQGGIIRQVLVAEGDWVIEGQPLIIVNGDRTLADGMPLEKTLLAEYANQRALLDRQINRSQQVFKDKKHDIEQQLLAANQDLELVENQLVTYNERHAIASSKASRYKLLNEQRHVSSIQYEAVVSEELALRSDIQSLERSQVSQRNQIAQLETRLRLLPATHHNALDNLQERLSGIAQQIARINGQRAHIVTAPRAGKVSSLRAHEGQKARAEVPVLSLTPRDGILQAKLLVPVRSIGFVTTEQRVDIRYDAFPFQKFGLYGARVTSVADTIILPGEISSLPVSINEPMYLVSTLLEQATAEAYGKRFPLKPGMTLSADVRLDDRTLIQWLLEPIYSLKGRL